MIDRLLYSVDFFKTISTDQHRLPNQRWIERLAFIRASDETPMTEDDTAVALSIYLRGWIQISINKNRVPFPGLAVPFTS